MGTQSGPAVNSPTGIFGLAISGYIDATRICPPGYQSATDIRRQYEPGHPYLRALNDLAIDPAITAHSIIAVLGDGPVTGKTDGVVAYESAHIDGVASEKVARSGHSTQSHPETIEEVRRILRAHLEVKLFTPSRRSNGTSELLPHPPIFCDRRRQEFSSE